MIPVGISLATPYRQAMRDATTFAPVMEAGPNSYAHAVEILRGGGLVALPTETVYGLAADAANDKAVMRIYAAKGRPSHNPLIAHIFEPKDARSLVKISPLAQCLMDNFWPGPLTLVLPKITDKISGAAGVGLDTLAIRCPATSWVSAFLELGFHGPIVMPSANRSGHISPTTARHVADDLGDKVDLIIDSGECPNGIESTVLKIEDDHTVLLRPGAIPAEDFVPYISDLRLPGITFPASAPAAPGMLKSHYAPKASVRLNALSKRPGEAYLAFGPSTIEYDYNLSPEGDLIEAARNLYSALRALDKVDTIAIAPIPKKGLGEAINDRLRRAAADRDA